MPPRADDAGNALQVGDKLNLLEACLGKQIGDRGRLSEADFENDKAAWDEGREGSGDETAIDFEAVGARTQETRAMRLESIEIAAVADDEKGRATSANPARASLLARVLGRGRNRAPAGVALSRGLGE